MNELDTMIAATLRSDAEEASARTDTASEARVLATRLDALDARRARWRWGAVAAVAATAVVVASVAVVVTHRATSPVPPAATPTATPSAWSDSAEILGAPQLDVPGWAAGITPLQAPRRFVRWEQSSCTSECVAGSDQKLMLLAPYTRIDAQGTSQGPLSVADYGQLLDELRTNPAVRMTEWHQESTAGAGVANVAEITTTADVTAAMGCEQLADSAGGCRALVRGTRNVVAVVDAGHAPLVVWLSALASTDAAAQDAEMRAVLASLRLTGLPVSCRGLLGPPEKTGCLEDLRTQVAREAVHQAGSDKATHAAYFAAVDPLVTALQDVQGMPAFSYSVETPVADDLSATTPLVTSWTLGATTEKVYVCFRGSAVVVTTTDCR